MSSVRRYRSGEAAKLVDMPAATLRIWEQRYGVISPATSASGQRQYSDLDVGRLRTIKSLVDKGHAIGAIAHLDNEQLSRLASGAGAPLSQSEPLSANLIIVGFGESVKPETPAGITCLTFNSVEDIPPGDDQRAMTNGMVVRVEALHEDKVLSIVAAARRIRCEQVLVVYAFGARRAIDLARLEGIELKRKSNALLHANEIIVDFVRSLRRDNASGSGHDPRWSRSPRRFNDETLANVASQSTTIACECPKHLAELVLQVSAFERYSDECLSRSPADALLHQHLGDAANKAVALFEDALAAIVAHEGWSIPGMGRRER